MTCPGFSSPEWLAAGRVGLSPPAVFGAEMKILVPLFNGEAEAEAET